jgi:hypothetical protein
METRAAALRQHLGADDLVRTDAREIIELAHLGTILNRFV